MTNFTAQNLVHRNYTYTRTVRPLRAPLGTFSGLNDRPAFGYVLCIGDEPVYRGTGVVKPYVAEIRRRFETDVEYSVFAKGAGHLDRLKDGTHVNKTLLKLFREHGDFRIELIAEYPTRRAALDAEIEDIRGGLFDTNVVGQPGATRTRHKKSTDLTLQQVTEIKALVDKKITTQENIGLLYGVSQPTISQIARGKHARQVQ